MLHTLVLTNNGVSTLPDGIFSDLTSLVTLGLANNGLDCTEENFRLWGIPSTIFTDNIGQFSSQFPPIFSR